MNKEYNIVWLWCIIQMNFFSVSALFTFSIIFHEPKKKCIWTCFETVNDFIYANLSDLGIEKM